MGVLPPPANLNVCKQHLKGRDQQGTTRCREMFPLFQLILLQRLIETLSPLGEGNRCRWSGRQWLRKTDGRPRPCLDLALNDGRVAARERNIVLVGGASVSAVREHERDARVARTGPPFAVIILCPTHLLCSCQAGKPSRDKPKRLLSPRSLRCRSSSNDCRAHRCTSHRRPS